MENNGGNGFINWFNLLILSFSYIFDRLRIPKKISSVQARMWAIRRKSHYWRGWVLLLKWPNIFLCQRTEFPPIGKGRVTTIPWTEIWYLIKELELSQRTCYYLAGYIIYSKEELCIPELKGRVHCRLLAKLGSKVYSLVWVEFIQRRSSSTLSVWWLTSSENKHDFPVILEVELNSECGTNSEHIIISMTKLSYI